MTCSTTTLQGLDVSGKAGWLKKMREKIESHNKASCEGTERKQRQQNGRFKMGIWSSERD